jgi:hypothetical protein
MRRETTPCHLDTVSHAGEDGPAVTLRCDFGAQDEAAQFSQCAVHLLPLMKRRTFRPMNVVLSIEVVAKDAEQLDSPRGIFLTGAGIGNDVA